MTTQNKLYRFAKDNIHMLYLAIIEADKVGQRVKLIDGKDYPVVMQWGLSDDSSTSTVILPLQQFATINSFGDYLWAMIDKTNQ